MRLYLDANAIIDVVEGKLPFQSRVVCGCAGASPGGTVITSRLSRLECRVKPLRDNDPALLKNYDIFFTRQRFQIVELSAPIVERATERRARYRFKTPDALHLATAIEGHATTFLTGDAALASCTELQVDVL